jgi:hypothetical protein
MPVNVIVDACAAAQIANDMMIAVGFFNLWLFLSTERSVLVGHPKAVSRLFLKKFLLRIYPANPEPP